MKKISLIFYGLCCSLLLIAQANTLTLEKNVYTPTEKIEVSFSGGSYYWGWIGLYEDNQDIFSNFTKAFAWDWTNSKSEGKLSLNNPGKAGRYFVTYRNGRTNSDATEISDRIYFYVTPDGTMPTKKAVVSLAKEQFEVSETKIRISIQINIHAADPWIAFYKEGTDTHSMFTNAGTENENWKKLSSSAATGSVELTNPGIGRWFVVLRNGKTGKYADDLSEYVYFDVVEKIKKPGISVINPIFSQGSEVVISYKYQQGNTNDKIEVYHNLSMLPLKIDESISGENGSISLGNQLLPGVYRAYYKNENGSMGGEEIHFEVTPKAQSASADSKKIAVISDVHIMAPELVRTDGTAFQQYLIEDRKLLKESYDITKSIINTLKEERPDVLLIPGDLTKDGERLSHETFVTLFDDLRSQGTKILIVPGNHDINNPHAVYFDGDVKNYAETVSAQEFKDIYANYGYADAYATDSHSLSYLNEPIPGLVVLGIDAAKYYDNTFISAGAKSDSCVTNGVIKPETLAWITDEVSKATKKGKQVIAMVHHNVVEHFDNQRHLAAPYVLDNFEQAQKVLMQAGVRVIFTGHFHSTDIKRAEGTDGEYLYDVETGSTVTYPCPYRIMKISNDKQFLTFDTKFILNTTEEYYTRNGKNFQEHAQQSLAGGIPTVMRWLVKEYYPMIKAKVPSILSIPDADGLADILVKHISDVVTKAMLTHNEGNEQLKQGDIVINEMNTAIDAAVYEVFGSMVHSIANSEIKKMQEYKWLIAMVKSMVENTIYSATSNSNIPMNRLPKTNMGYIDDLTGTIALKPIANNTPTAVHESTAERMKTSYNKNTRVLHITLTHPANNRITVYNVQGKKVAEFYTDKSEKQFSAACYITTPGIYLINIDGLQTTSRKIIAQ